MVFSWVISFRLAMACPLLFSFAFIQAADVVLNNGELLENGCSNQVSRNSGTVAAQHLHYCAYSWRSSTLTGSLISHMQGHRGHTLLKLLHPDIGSLWRTLVSSSAIGSRFLDLSKTSEVYPTRPNSSSWCRL